MKLFALSDLHLSLSAPYLAGSGASPQAYKPMDMFGEQWRDFFLRLEKNWLDTVGKDDAVLIAGDISWALTLPEATYDLGYLASLPGKKVLIKGNHDYWWSSVSRLRDAVDPSIIILQHSAVALAGYAVCGTRGWLAPEHAEFKEKDDRKLYDRELLRLEMALREAAGLRLPIIAMLHYPPLLQAEQESGFCRLLGAYQVKTCVYGHVHGDKAGAFEGEHDGVLYRNCSVDRLGFVPLLVAAVEDKP